MKAFIKGQIQGFFNGCISTITGVLGWRKVLFSSTLMDIWANDEEFPAAGG